jgi:hypothetical protein
VGGQHHFLAALPPGKTRYSLYRRLGGPQGQTGGRVRKISPPPGFDPWSVQPVVSRYTDWATLPTILGNVIYHNCFQLLEIRPDDTWYSRKKLFSNYINKNTLIQFCLTVILTISITESNTTGCTLASSSHFLLYLRFSHCGTALGSFLYLLTPWSRVLLEKLTRLCSKSRIYPRFYGPRKFCAVLTSTRHRSLSWGNSIQSPQHPPPSWSSILTLSLPNYIPSIIRVILVAGKVFTHICDTG